MKLYQTFIHPTVQKHLKMSAVERDQTIPERLHDILCGALGLEHLMLGPDRDAAV